MEWMNRFIEYSSIGELKNKAFDVYLYLRTLDLYHNSKDVYIGPNTSEDINSEFFKHLITAGRPSHNPTRREFDKERTKRIHWIEHVIFFCTHPDLKPRVYTKLHKGRNRIHILIPKCFYLTILEERDNGYALVSSFHIDNQASMGRYMREYKKYR